MYLLFMRELIRRIIHEQIIGQKSERLGNDEFIKKLKDIHGDKYDYSLTNYQGREKPITMICPKHGEFTLIAKNAHRGCQKCSLENRPSTKLTTDQFIEKSKEKHGNKYDYSKVDYNGTFNPVTIICPIHGEFEQQPVIHLKGSGCQRCKDSKGERLINGILRKNNIKFIAGKRFEDCTNVNTDKSCRTLPFDFYLPDLNTCIEYDGIQHYQPVEQFGGKQGFIETKIRDNIKTMYCDKSGKKLIRVPYVIKDEDVESYVLTQLLDQKGVGDNQFPGL
jgi:hypothetical protein